MLPKLVRRPLPKNSSGKNYSIPPIFRNIRVTIGQNNIQSVIVPRSGILGDACRRKSTCSAKADFATLVVDWASEQLSLPARGIVSYGRRWGKRSLRMSGRAVKIRFRQYVWLCMGDWCFPSFRAGTHSEVEYISSSSQVFRK